MQLQERTESIKAGILGAFSFALADVTCNFFNHLIDLLANWQLTINHSHSLFDWLFQLIIAVSSGFLFALTYRYIMRGDTNSHLSDGAVLAFAIVRGLALLQGIELFSNLFWYRGILCVETLICFTCVRYSLDLAFKSRLIKRF